MPNMNSMQFKLNELYRYHFDCHGKLVSTATMCLSSQGYFVPNMISTGLKTYKLLRYHYHCYSKLVTTAMRYVADTYHTKKTSCQI